MKVLPFLPPSLSPVGMLTASLQTVRQLQTLCDLRVDLRVPAVVLRATALELAILAGHLLLYPSGLIQERPAPDHPDPGPDLAPGLGRTMGPALPPDARAAEAPGAETSGAEAPAPPTALPLGSPDHPPVVLLHGFADNRSVFVLLRRSLARSGWHHLECLNYSPLTCDIRAAAELLGRHIEEICARTGRREVDIVGHSLGGLIARYYAQCLGGDLRVRTLVTLGTPHSGTTVAPLASAHPIVRQMRPGSDFIEELRDPAPGCRTRFVSFWSDLDQLMTPVESARVDHPDLLTENVRVSGIGHLALPVHPAVAARIRESLEASEFPAKSEGAVSVA
ncbi:esterase/lipase family protein [Streptomyces sp. NPDC004838]